MLDMNVMLTTGESAGATSGGVMDMLSDGLAVAGELVAFTWDVIVANPILSVFVVMGLIAAGVGLFAHIKHTAK